jgi:putative membrane protein
VVLLIAYHLKNQQIFLQLQRDEVRHTSKFMRLWNEGATLILFAVVFLVVFKTTFNWIFGIVGLVVLALLLLLGIRLYKTIRERDPEA